MMNGLLTTLWGWLFVFSASSTFTRSQCSPFALALDLPFFARTMKGSKPSVGRHTLTKQKYRLLDEQEELMNDRSRLIHNLVKDLRKTHKSTRLHPSLEPALRSSLSNYLTDSTHSKTPTVTNAVVHNVEDLRHFVLDCNIDFHKVSLGTNLLQENRTLANDLPIQNHEVVQLIADRFHSGSTPRNRAANDTARLALCLEGGGVRGAVTAGMASCLAVLGLCDTIDVLYGSSAGSVIGAYMVSRQIVCMDVFVDILPAAKRAFVCHLRMLSAIFRTAVDCLLWRRILPERIASYRPSWWRGPAPGMNISFVLDGIMSEQNGVRPLDLDIFMENNEKQPLRVASSYVKGGKLLSKTFGTEHFLKGESIKEALFSSLHASMTVPGAAGPPVQIVDGNETSSFFDAFCFEPIPYRSAVEEGATHCLVLCSRPEDFVPKNKPGAYEKAVAPIYFRSHREEEVARFFENGGQQYIYAEDLLTLKEAKKSERGRVKVPPPSPLYGVPVDDKIERLSTYRNEWKDAFLFPLQVPSGTAELSTLEQSRETVLEGVRGGFAAAFDILAPAIGIQLDTKLSGADVAEFVFPDDCLKDGLHHRQRLHVQGERITHKPNSSALGQLLRGFTRAPRAARAERSSIEDKQLTTKDSDASHLKELFQRLPGFRHKNLLHVAGRMCNSLSSP